MSCSQDTSCPNWMVEMGTTFSDPLETTLKNFTSDKTYWDAPDHGSADRDTRTLQYASSKSSGRVAQVPACFANRTDIWGGGLRNMTSGGVGPRREDERYIAPRYVPINFAKYVSPVIDPGDFRFYISGPWRVAVPRTTSGPATRALLNRIGQSGPSSAGYVRIGDYLVPANYGPGDRQTLADTKTQYGPSGRKYPYE